MNATTSASLGRARGWLEGRLGREPPRPVRLRQPRSVALLPRAARPRATSPAEDRAPDADHQRPGQPDELDEHEAGRDRPEHRADEVGGIQTAECAAEAAFRGPEISGQARQRRAHEDRRRREREDREAEPDEPERARRRRQLRVDAAIRLVEQVERDRRDHGHDRDADLEEAVHPQRRADPVGEPAAEPGADRHASEEAGEDRADRLGRVAEDDDELARPHDLVDEAGGAGQHEEQEDDLRADPRRGDLERGRARQAGVRGPWGDHEVQDSSARPPITHLKVPARCRQRAFASDRSGTPAGP